MAQVTTLDLNGVMGRVRSFTAKTEATTEFPACIALGIEHVNKIAVAVEHINKISISIDKPDQ